MFNFMLGLIAGVLIIGLREEMQTYKMVANALTAMGLNVKNFRGCSQCNWVSNMSLGATTCPDCKEPLRPINW